MNTSRRWQLLLTTTSRLTVLSCLAFPFLTPLGQAIGQETTQGSALVQPTTPAIEQPSGENPPNADTMHATDKGELLDNKPADPTIEIPKTWIRLSPKEEIWLDHKKKQVIVGGEICLTAGQLEMFICPPQTKLHESVVVAKCQSWQVHAALVAIGASPGKTAQWAPDYQAAWGPKIDIEMFWRDKASGKTKHVNAKQWIQNLHTEKAMKADWVFGGSIMDKNPETAENVYLGNFGELVCLSNFSTATIDLNIESSEHESLFVAFEKNIPPMGTQVYAVLKPGAIVGKPSQAKTPKAPSDTSQATTTEASATTPNATPATSGDSPSTDTSSVEKIQTNK